MPADYQRLRAWLDSYEPPDTMIEIILGKRDNGSPCSMTVNRRKYAAYLLANGKSPESAMVRMGTWHVAVKRFKLASETADSSSSSKRGKPLLSLTLD